RSSLPFLSTHPPPPHTYTLSLHDALPISLICTAPWSLPPRDLHGTWFHAFARPIRARPPRASGRGPPAAGPGQRTGSARGSDARDRKSTRLNSSHVSISYAVFCLKKKTTL